MIISHYAIIKLQRDEKRQWTVLGQCNDIPGECRPALIYPIVAMIDPDDGLVKRIPRTHGKGWIDTKEQFAYVKMNFWKRQLQDEVTAIMTLRVELQTVRCLGCKADLPKSWDSPFCVDCHDSASRDPGYGG